MFKFRCENYSTLIEFDTARQKSFDPNYYNYAWHLVGELFKYEIS